jgi:hypothetical protein
MKRRSSVHNIIGNNDNNKRRRLNEIESLEYAQNQTNNDSTAQTTSENIFVYKNFTNSTTRRQLLKEALLKKIKTTSGIISNSPQSFVWSLNAKQDAEYKENERESNIIVVHNEENVPSNEKNKKNTVVNVYKTINLDKNNKQCNSGSSNEKMSICYINNEECTMSHLPNVSEF